MGPQAHSSLESLATHHTRWRAECLVISAIMRLREHFAADPAHFSAISRLFRTPARPDVFLVPFGRLFAGIFPTARATRLMTADMVDKEVLSLKSKKKSCMYFKTNLTDADRYALSYHWTT